MSDAAAWLQEAWETGNPLAPLPPELAPRDDATGEAIAAALAEKLALPVCGLRLAPGPGGSWLAGPMLEPRMLRAGTPIALPALRHPRLSAAVLGVLGEELGEEGEPVFSAIHPALDVSAQRWRDPAPDAPNQLADLNALGLVLVGKRSAAPLPEKAEARLGITGTRPRPIQENLAALMAQAVAAARRWGGLPAGSVIVLAGLGGQQVAQPGQKWSAAIAGVGRINAVTG
jgi:2-keto-4-pentenoate hydratase